MALIGEALTERACNDLRATLERIGGAPEIIEAAVEHLRETHTRDHCRACGTFLVDRADGSKYPCVRCSAPRQPWPKSRQGYRPSR